MESKYQMSMDEMEERIGRKIGTFEGIQFLKNGSGRSTEWHFLESINVWSNINWE